MNLYRVKKCFKRLYNKKAAEYPRDLALQHVILITKHYYITIL